MISRLAGSLLLGRCTFDLAEQVRDTLLMPSYGFMRHFLPAKKDLIVLTSPYALGSGLLHIPSRLLPSQECDTLCGGRGGEEPVPFFPPFSFLSLTHATHTVARGRG